MATRVFDIGPEPATPPIQHLDGGARSVAQLKMLHSLAAQLNRLNDVRQIGEAITAELRNLIDYHNCRVFVLSPDGETLIPIAFRGELLEYQGETFEALVTKVGTGLTGHVALTGQSYYSANANDDPYAITIPGTPEVDESILAVPLSVGEVVIGVVVLSSLGIDQFDQEDLRVLEVLASHAGVAIQNAQLLEREREASQRLRDLDEMKNTFLQAVSHDLRTPLAAVLGLALTLERRDLDLSDDDRYDLTSRLAANARKLDRILSNLLDLERLIRGVIEPNRAPTDVGALVRRIVGEADFLGKRTVRVDALPVVADVDGAKVERIVENLLVNAGKHTPDATPVWVRVLPEGDGVLVVVEDAGPGVPPEAWLSIFEPFQQGPQEQPSPGSGIGLSLVARFAELHGGRAWVEERPGGGASFRVFLPGVPA